MRMTACFMLFALATAYAHSPDKSFVIDGTRPYAYLQFDHIGPRKPLHEGEPLVGLWLRIVNNCRVPIEVKSYGVPTGDPGTGVFDEVIPLQQDGITVQADSLEVPLSTGDKAVKEFANIAPTKIPQGYSAELSSATRILPGGDLLFSVPRDHVSRNWFLRVKFTLAVNEPAVGPGPFTELDFFNDQIPTSNR